MNSSPLISYKTKIWRHLKTCSQTVPVVKKEPLANILTKNMLH